MTEAAPDAAARRGRPEPRRFIWSSLEQLGALLDRPGVARVGVLKALRVLLELGRRRVAARRAAARATGARAGGARAARARRARSAEPAERAAELLLELRDRPRVSRSGDRLLLAHLREV